MLSPPKKTVQDCLVSKTTSAIWSKKNPSDFLKLGFFLSSFECTYNMFICQVANRALLAAGQSMSRDTSRPESPVLGNKGPFTLF